MSGERESLSASPVEWWLCSECLHIERADKWGIEGDNNDSAVCPGCGFVHYDNEMSAVYAGTQDEMSFQAAVLASEDDE